MSWTRMIETSVEKKWCWWTLAYESGHWIYLFSNRTNRLVAKIFVWQWEEEEELKGKNEK